jgi:hypothetical protein
MTTNIVPHFVFTFGDTQPEDLGMIPFWLDETDPRPATQQLDAHYGHGGGWRPQEGFKLQKDNALKYPGDPAMQPIACMILRNEMILMYPYGYVAVLQKDGSFEACRMD